MFGRATITLGIGPHASFVSFFLNHYLHILATFNGGVRRQLGGLGKILNPKF